MFYFLRNSKDHFLWGLGAMEMQLSLKRTDGLGEGGGGVFYDLKNQTEN